MCFLKSVCFIENGRFADKRPFGGQKKYMPNEDLVASSILTAAHPRDALTPEPGVSKDWF